MLGWIKGKLMADRRPIELTLSRAEPGYTQTIWPWYGHAVDGSIKFALSMRGNCPDNKSRNKHLRHSLKEAEKHLANHRKCVNDLENDVRVLRQACRICNLQGDEHAHD